MKLFAVQKMKLWKCGRRAMRRVQRVARVLRKDVRIRSTVLSSGGSGGGLWCLAEYGSGFDVRLRDDGLACAERCRR